MALLAGVKLAARTVDVPIGETEEGQEVSLRLTAPGVLALTRVRAELPDPEPPRTGPALRDDQGNPVRDGNGCVICEANPDCPSFAEAVERCNIAKGIALVLLTAGESIEIDVQRGEFTSAEAYYLAAWEELEAAGLDAQAFQALSEAAMDLVRISADELGESADLLGK